MGGGKTRWSHIKDHNIVWLTSPAGKLTDEAVREALTPVGLQVGRVLWPEEMDSANHLELSIPFFSEEQLGAAHQLGPVGLNVILSFNEELRGTMAKLNEEAVLCVACTGRPGALANSLLLVGAFLLLERSMSAEDALTELFPAGPGVRPPSDIRFPRPWSHTPEFSEDSLTLEDCILGLEVAVDRGWLSTDSLPGPDSLSVLSYDAAHICTIAVAEEGTQGVGAMSLWVAADPVTTVKDPHSRPDPSEVVLTPKSCSTPSSRRWSLNLLHSPTSKHSEDVQECDPEAVWRKRAPKRTSSLGRLGDSFLKKTAIPSKSAALIATSSKERPADLPTFARWLTNTLECRLIVRANHSNEKGLPGGSYGDFFDRWGVKQLDVPFADGTAPPNELVQKVVKHVKDVLLILQMGARGQTADSPCSVVLHCKSGLGRSMLLIGAVAVAFTPGLRASTYFGWARLVRPGSIQTAEQERFLRAMDEVSIFTRCFRCFRPASDES